MAPSESGSEMAREEIHNAQEDNYEPETPSDAMDIVLGTAAEVTKFVGVETGLLDSKQDELFILLRQGATNETYRVVSEKLSKARDPFKKVLYALKKTGDAASALISLMCDSEDMEGSEKEMDVETPKSWRTFNCYHLWEPYERWMNDTIGVVESMSTSMGVAKDQVEKNKAQLDHTMQPLTSTRLRDREVDLQKPRAVKKKLESLAKTFETLDESCMRLHSFLSEIRKWFADLPPSARPVKRYQPPSEQTFQVPAKKMKPEPVQNTRKVSYFQKKPKMRVKAEPVFRVKAEPQF